MGLMSKQSGFFWSRDKRKLLSSGAWLLLLLILCPLLLITLGGSRSSSRKLASDAYISHHLPNARVCDRRRYQATDTLLEDRITILVNGFSEARLPLLRKNMFTYSQSLIVEAIYVLWGNISTPEYIIGNQWATGGAPIQVLRQPTTSLNDRFLPREFIRTKVVAICDDDITADDKSLRFALQVWQENQHRIVGFFPRAHLYSLPTQSWQYLKLPDRYSIMLTKLMLLHTNYLYHYTCNTPPGVKEFVDKGMNCEDIAMNFLVASQTGAGPLLVEGTPRDWGDTRNSEEDLSAVGLSAREGHRKDRGLCLAAFQKLWGGMELRYSYSKAVPNVTEQVFCDKFGVSVHCDKRAITRLQALRAVGQHIRIRETRYAYTTLIGSPDFIPAALVLAQSLHSTGTLHDLVLMIDDTSDLNWKDIILTSHYDRVMKVKSVVNKYRVKGFNKLNAWLLEEYAKVVYIDVDTMVLANLDHLFDHPEPAAVPDVYMSGKFNSGVLVIKPSKVTYDDMISQLDILPSYNKGDQGFLNAYYSGWFDMPAAHRLPARYNGVFLFPPHYHPPAWYDMNTIHEALGPIAVVHFAGPWHKPWRLGTNSSDIVWCHMWLRMSQALESNNWRPLHDGQLSLLDMLPNSGDYVNFPEAPNGVVPLGQGQNKRAPHVQSLPPRATGSSEAFVTVMWEDSLFVSGVWATSYQQQHTFNSWRKTMLLVLSTIDPSRWEPYVHLFNYVRVVEPIVMQGRQLDPEFSILNVWNQQAGFDKLVYVHPLSFFTDNCNDLMRYEPFAAIPSVFPPDMFSSRVMVLQPSRDTFKDMLQKLTVLTYPENSVDRFLNAYYFDWFEKAPLHRIPPSYGVDMWFKEGLMKFFLPWKILTFDVRAPPWSDISEWMANDRTKAVKLWRRTFCSLESDLRPTELDRICGEVNL
eukprot:TRINITY_DN23893_c0_g1_i1.p1 TRINITY_DN23893_c0_g1~~TRINITY_DN23893_c0_g1_i1.p1  ORF type:complete len:919 (-),score=79.21 TRINITY_DN23893_c0_g1_i1:91-2847(-)